MVQQHRSVLAQQTFPFEGRVLEDEVGRGRSGKDGIPQGSFVDGFGGKGREWREQRSCCWKESLVWGSCDVKSEDGKERRTKRRATSEAVIITTN
jgi:hypothetical protein